VEVNEEETAKLQTEWFQKFVKFAMDSRWYGYEVIEFGNIVDDAFMRVEKVPEEYVIPERQVVKKDLRISSSGSGKDVIQYREMPYKNWNIAVGGCNYDLGLLNKATPLVLWKKNVMGAWAEFAELYGMPIRIGKTNTKEPERREAMDAALQNMASAAWATMDLDDEIDLTSSSNNGGGAIYDKLVERVNSEISKLVMGQTMTSDNGSSRSQAEVHERVANDFVSSDRRFISDTVNLQLLPLMEFHRMIPEGLHFRWVFEEKVDILDAKDIVKDLSQYYEFDTEQLSKRFGFKIWSKKLELEDTTPANILNQIHNLYKGDTDSI